MYKAYKFRLQPNKEQEVFFNKTFGCTRFVYNKMLAERKEIYETFKDNKEEFKKQKNPTPAKYKTGASGYFALFINGVKIAQVSISDASFVPSSQKFEIGKGSNNETKEIYYLRMDNTALSDSEIINIQNYEWKITDPSLSLPVNLSYTAWGDSTTWTQANGRHYPRLVYEYLRDNIGKVRYYNKGLGGITSTGLITNLNSCNYIDADIVTLCVGMNDCYNQGIPINTYKANLRTAINFLKSRNPDVKIILCTPSRSSDANRIPYIADYRTAMQDIATEYNLPCCHFEDAWVQDDTSIYTSDGIHPNEAGHALLMNILMPVVASILT